MTQHLKSMQLTCHANVEILEKAMRGLNKTDTVEKFRLGDQWFYRGNRSPTWLFLASRPDGSHCGIAEKVPRDWWPLLEEIASLRQQLSELEKEER